MSQIIAGIYELEKEIGSGGGGIVYIGRHMRLEKKVVLKADKRRLSTGVEKLRREVDLLKGLSHTYIPQVYDFVQEDDTVYTVMDYIEGESLDKLLARGEIITQPQVIGWACQLLEALKYLHSQEPHGILHGDIKPANIMLRPNGDICLIDYNIALALGENGAVKVGFSRGYASPEHYGAEFISRQRRTIAEETAISAETVIAEETAISAETAVAEETAIAEDTETTTVSEGTATAVPSAIAKNNKTLASKQISFSAGSRVTEGKEGVLLDVRSDIYSLGATLYHLISGHRPPQDAREVPPLGKEYCSKMVSLILQKAMAPQPDDRFQTAEEMFNAFLQLHKKDIRYVRYKHQITVTVIMLAGIFLAGGACTFVGLKQMEQRQAALTMAEYSANALAEGDIAAAVSQAMQAIPSEKTILDAPITAEAQMALTNALGVYDLSEGFKALATMELPGAPFNIVASPGGTHIAVIYAYKVMLLDMANQEQIAELPIQQSALSDCFFVDEISIVYAGEQGITCYDLSTQSVRWTGAAATTLALSADHQVVAAVNRDEDKAILYSIADGNKVTERSFDGLHLKVAANNIFANPKNNIFALNEDGSMLAVSFSNGGLFIFDMDNPEGDLIIYEESDYQYFQGGFYGRYFAYTAEKSDETQFGMVDVEEASFIGGYAVLDKLTLQADEQGIYLARGGVLECIEPETQAEREVAYADDAQIIAFSVGKEYALAAMDNGSFSFFDSGANRMSMESCEQNCDFAVLTESYAVLGNRNEPSIRILKLENHKEAQLLSYDAWYEHDEARVSQDGSTVMLFGYKKFRIYDMAGNIVGEQDMPDAANIYDQQFVRENGNSWLEVIWYDGTRRCYSAADGSLISEKLGDIPRKDLYEEFFTERYRIVSNLHETPKVFDKHSGKLEAVLETDDYLTYVTQVGEYIVTEYVTAEGERYGFLLDANLQKLAYLPCLCDIIDDTFIFDYKSGNLRQCRLYSLHELTALGEQYITK